MRPWSRPASSWNLANKERIWLFIFHDFEHLYFIALIDLLINFSIHFEKNAEF